MTTGDGRPALVHRVRWSPAAIAGPAERAAAWLVDGAIFWVVWVAGMILLIETGEVGDPPRWTAPRALVWFALVWLLSCSYDALCLARWGSTAGRRVLGIEVRDRAGALPPTLAAVARSVVRALGLLVLGAGLVGLWTDPRRRGLHDRVAGTMVVRTAALEAVDGRPGGEVDDDGPAEPTEVAIREAHVDPATAGWLRALAAQTETRLDVTAPSWRRGDDPQQTAQRAFCLLVAALIARYPDQRTPLRRVLDAHRVLHDVTGDRERDVTRLLADRDRARRWLGLPDTADVQLLVGAPAQPDPAVSPARAPAGR